MVVASMPWSMVSQRFSKPFAPTVEVGFTRIEAGAFETHGLDRQMDMGMHGGVRIWIGLNGVEHHRVLMSRKFSFGKVMRRALRTLP